MQITQVLHIIQIDGYTENGVLVSRTYTHKTKQESVAEFNRDIHKIESEMRSYRNKFYA